MLSFRAQKGAFRLLGMGGAAVQITGDTVEHALATVIIPGGAMGPKGVLRIASLRSSTVSSANNKTLRYRLGGTGLAGSVLLNVNQTTNLSAMDERVVWNRDAQNSQVTMASALAASFGGNAAGPTTAAVDMSVDQQLVISGQLASAAENMSLDAWLVEICSGL